MQILSHVLVSPNVTRVACGKNRTQLAAPDTIVMHYTGGGDARSSALYLADPATKASAHVVVARDGQVFQLVPFNTRAWHAGVSALEGRTNVNAFSLALSWQMPGGLPGGMTVGSLGLARKSLPRKFVWLWGRRVSPIGMLIRLCNCAWRQGFASCS